MRLLQTSHSAFMQLAQDGCSGTVIAEYPRDVGTVGAVIPIAGVPLEESLVSAVRPIQIADIDQEPNFDAVANIMRRFGIRSAVIIPVVVNGRTIGSFSLDSIGSLRVFSADEIERCSLFAMQVQMALENSFLLEESRQSRERLDLMLRANEVLLEAPDLSALAFLIAGLRGVDSCRILLLDEFTVSLAVKAGKAADGVSWNPGIGESWPLPGDHGYGELLASPGFQVLRRASEAQRNWLDTVTQRLQLRERIQSLLIVPMRCRGVPIGLLEIAEWRGGPSPFDTERIGLVSAIAAQAAVQLDNWRNHELSERRRKLLEALERHSENLVAEREPDKILQETVRLGRSLIGGAASGLFQNGPDGLKLIHASGLPGPPADVTIPAGDDVIGGVIGDGQPRLIFPPGDSSVSGGWFSVMGFNSVAVVPLAHRGNVVFALFVAQRAPGRRFGDADLEILARLAGRAIAAWNSASLLSNDARRMQLLAVLDHSLSFLRSANELDRIYHVIVTTITAGWGLRLNRAVLLMLDDWRQVLQGAMGIGQFTHQAAEEAWREAKAQGLNDPLRYLALVRNQLPPDAELHKLATELRIPVPAASKEPFFDALRYPLPRLLSPGEIPEGLFELLQPETDVVVAPLMVEGNAIGVVVGDHKFTRERTTDEDLDILRSFCDAAASTIQNVRRRREDYLAQRRLRELLAHSEKIAAPEDGFTSLELILRRSVEAAQADAASVIVRDDTQQLRQLIAWPRDRAHLFENLSSHYVTTDALTGPARVFEDLNEQRDALNPDRFGSEYGAAACFPVRSPIRQLAVLWLFYRHARRFPPGEVRDLQSYFNLAGVTYDSTRRAEETDLLLSAARATSTRFELDDVLDSILEQACRTTGADAATVWPWDDRAHKFLVHKARSVGIPTEELHAPARGQNTWRILEKGYESSGDPWKGPRQSPATQEMLQHHSIQSYQGILMKVGKERVGVLYVSYKGDKPRRSFWAWERHLLESYSVFAALALRRAELWQQLGRVKQGVETVAKVTVRGKLTKTLQSLAEQAMEAADCDAVTLYLWDDKEKRMRLPPVMHGVWYPDRVEKYDQQPLISLLRDVFASDEPTINAPAFREMRFARDEKIHTCVALPLIFAGKEKTGLLFINYRSAEPPALPREISHDDVEILKLLARQAAVTLHHALLIEQRTEELETSNRIRRGLEALNQASRAIIGGTRDEVIQLIVRCAVQCVDDETRTGTSLGALLTFEKDTNSLIFREVYPPPSGQVLFQAVGEKISLDSGTGIIRRSALSRSPQRVADVAADGDYLCYSVDTRSELAVPMLLPNGDLIGVLDVESDQLDFFDEHDEKLLTALAELAVLAIETDRLRRNAEEADKRVIQQLAKGCHDIKKPMNVISLLLQKLLNGIYGQLTDQGEEFARKAVQGIGETSKLIEDIVAIARLQSGMTTDIEREAYDLGRLLSEARSYYSDQAEKARIALKLELPGDVLRAAIYVPALRRSLNNLLENALKFTPGGGTVWLRAYRQGAEVFLSVRDNGPGIEPALHARIFDFGFTSSASGSGLGLTIAKGFVELHGGRIEVVSNPGEGATFRIVLPVGAETEEGTRNGEG
jgi:signal transduction histidine kinase